MEIVIKKAAIRGSLFLNYEFEQTDMDVKNTIKTSSDAPIHDDLRNAFRSLIPLFVHICEEIRDEALIKKAIKDPESYLEDMDTAVDQSFFKYRVFDFKINENKGTEYVYLTGSKRLESNDSINFTTPGIILGDNDYKFWSELQDAIDHVKKEVLLYMQGKSAPKSQLKMFDGEENDDFDDFDTQMAEASKKLKGKLKESNVTMEVITK